MPGPPAGPDAPLVRVPFDEEGDRVRPSHVGLLLVAAVPCAACRTRDGTASPEGSMKGEGERVSIVGIAREAKVGPIVETEKGIVWIGDLECWPERVVGRRVRVEGVNPQPSSRLTVSGRISQWPVATGRGR